MQMKALSLLVAGCFATAAQADVYISEYIEGSSNNKAIEIYNGSANSVDLSTYSLNFFFNGNESASTVINLAGTLEANSVYVVADNDANADILAKANLTNGSGFFNGDDAIELKDGDTVIDSIGQVGVDPGSSWQSGDVSTQNTTLLRIDAISLGDSDSSNEFDPSVEWSALPQDDISNLGTHKGCCDGGDDGGGGDGGDGGDSGATSGAPLMLTAVFDGPLSGGVPKGVELYVTEDIADLSVCGLGSANNGGGSDGQEFTFDSGVSASAGDFIYVSSESNGFTEFFGFAPNFVTGAMSINGDDAIELYCNGEVIDLFGDIDVDGNGEIWEYLDSYAYRVSETLASPTFVATDWVFAGANALDGASSNDGTIPVGSFEFAAGSLFFSEYIEGSSNNKALEIVNLTGTQQTLTGNYSVEIYFNGSASAGRTIGLEGTVANGDVFVLVNDRATQEVIDVSDQLTGSLSFNGDDAVVLRGPAGEILDVIGTIGEDPGSQWGQGDASTADNTLLRNTNIRIGDTNPDDAFDPSVEWSGLPRDSFADLGRFGDNGDDGGDGGEPVALGQCGDDAVLISAIQGTGDASLMTGTELVVEASVTMVAPGLEGFFIQEESAQSDNNPMSSEGIFVFTGGSEITVNEGELVRVLGTVNEFFNKTQITANEVSASCGTGEYAVTELTLPLAEGESFEALEGMAIRSSQALTIISNFTYARFGEVEVASERLFNPTHLHTPGSQAAIDLAASNARNRVLLDDALNGAPENLDLNGEFSAQNTLRTGSKVSGIDGVMDYGFNAYRIQPKTAPVVQASLRPDAPSVEGDLKVASFNVLNLFNGDGQGGDFPTSRGADDVAEYELQLAKIANAIVALDASVVGLMEIENDGFGPNSSIAQLVDALNERAGEGVYSFIDAGEPQGTDQITVGLVYQSAEVTPVGALRVLDESNSVADENGPLFNTRRNRPSFAQQFSPVGSDDTFVVNVNHLKSKGSGCGAGDDSADQGNCNGTRTRAAKAVHIWLASIFADEPVFIVGDLNSYAKEDPIAELQGAGFVDLARDFDGPTAYSYTFRGEFGSLDYALANSKARPLVKDVLEWHINADEPIALDYNDEISRNVDKPESFRDDSVYRSSDHDPVLVGFSFEAPTPPTPPAVPGDVNGDGEVNPSDYAAIYRILGANSGDANFNPAADLNQDGTINFRDLKTWFFTYRN
ncbi:ExeM/NucH family extracellular endonuclease [Glaciecola siphonariae]|uniref:ExeM/NucH family extracellular endonuclease n=1 Tax=Glaciecola siphonariae TaxID=521012 RepID=A0ABV9M076_9ALTE